MTLHLEINPDQIASLARAIAIELRRESGATPATQSKGPGAQIAADMKEIIVEMRYQLASNDSPWTNREGAAAYCCCSIDQVDAAANQGKVTRYRGTGKPMFRKSGGKGSLDAWIEGKAVPKAQ